MNATGGVTYFARDPLRSYFHSWKYERNEYHAKLTSRIWGVTYFARDPLRLYFHEHQINKHLFLKYPPYLFLRSSSDINECLEIARLCDGGTCKNTLGSFTCTCPPGSRFSPEHRMCEGRYCLIYKINKRKCRYFCSVDRYVIHLRATKQNRYAVFLRKHFVRIKAFGHIPTINC